jgi:BirA family biotin operon repressor/biotin-[acetyl-CoA-carboxylase] ligase
VDVDSREGVWARHAGSPYVVRALARASLLDGIHPVADVGSTQDVARVLARDGCPAGTVVIADHQHAGRGRSGRRWDDHPDGGTLAMTVVLDAGTTAEEGAVGRSLDVSPLVPHALGLAVVMACRTVVPAAAALRLKWPNDVVHRGGADGRPRKLSGVLVERERIEGPDRRGDVLLCGIGVDVDLRAAGAAPDRICLADLLGADVDRAALLAALIEHLDGSLALLHRSPSELLDRYRRVSDTIGRHVSVELVGERLAGTATSVDDEGRLLVATGAGIRAILSGTVRDTGAGDDAEEPE